ncbi:nucleolin isoform X2 [Triplophysa rosa]|uniref:nucleolin isoform X2 n=1 Tax=Triplophysa rosa TaxID=992332 RepID=UPI0025462FBC|nr:nucleolin isoform X2 [Triplophysa rosa]
MMELAEAPQAENSLPPPKEVKKEASEEDIFEEEALLTEDNKDSDYLKNDVTDPRTLFIKNLPFSVKRDELKKVFDQATDIEIPVDNEGSTKGYAFVEFESVDDAAEALKTCNKIRIRDKKGDYIDGRGNSESPVTQAKRKAYTKDKETPPAKKTKSYGEGFSLLIDSLIPGMAFKEMKSAVRTFFSEEGIEIQGVRHGRSTEFGYVEFASEEDLKKALELNGKKLRDQPLKLDTASYKENFQEIQERDARTLFIKNLPHSTKQDDLKEIFPEAIDVRLPFGKNGFTRGIAYIEFATEAIADKVFEEAQGSDVKGNSIVIDYTGKKTTGLLDINPTSRLIIKNLSFNVTEDSLRGMFEKAVIVKIPYKYDSPQGYALVEFESVDDAKEAMETWNFKELDGRMVRLTYMTKKEKKKDEEGDSASHVTQVKRKTDTKDKETPPAKKVKSDEEEFILLVGKLNLKKDVHEIKSAISHFFSNEGLKIQKVRLDITKKFGHVNFASEKELQKALELDGKNLMGQPVKLDRARSKDLVGNKAANLSNKILVVHNLSYSVTVHTLRRVFEKSVAIRIPQKDGRLQGFAFVQFESVEDAKEALENCNNKEIEGRIVHIEICKSKEERDGGGMGNFGGGHQDITEKREIDQSYFRFGFVEFESVEDAEEALETCNNAVIEGRNIRLEFCQSREDKEAEIGNSAAFSSSKALKNVPFSATKDSNQSVPEKSVSIKIPLNIGNQKGRAFMEFTSVEDAIEALKTVNKAEIEGQSVTRCHTVFSQSKKMEEKVEGERWSSRPLKTLFVRGLSEETKDQTLKNAFDGAVSAKIITDRDTGSSKGFGYVNFDSEEDCKAAREAMDDCEINGKKVSVDYAQPEGGRGRGGSFGQGRGGFGGRGGGRGGFGGRGGGRGGFGGRGGGRGGFGGRGGGRGGFGGRGGGRGGFGGRGGGRGGFGGRGGGRGGFGERGGGRGGFGERGGGRGGFGERGGETCGFGGRGGGCGRGSGFRGRSRGRGGGRGSGN